MKKKGLIIGLLLALTLTGCSDGGYASKVDTQVAYESNSEIRSGYEVPAKSVSYDNSTTAYEESYKENNGQVAKQKTQNNDKLVYSSSIRMQTLVYADTINKVRDSIRKYNGFVEYENETNSDTYWYDEQKAGGTMMMNMTVRIPTEHYDEFMNDLEGDGKIISRTANVTNISHEYHDTETIIANLRSQLERLQDMMKEARTIDEMITIETRISEVQTQLDQYNTQVSYMDSRVDYSTIDLSIEEVRKYTEKTGATFGERFMQALHGSKTLFLNFLEWILFFIIYMFPIAVVIGLIVWIIIILTRKMPKKTKSVRPPRERRIGPNKEERERLVEPNKTEENERPMNPDNPEENEK